MGSLDEILESRKKPRRKVSFEGLNHRVRVWENTYGTYQNSKIKMVGKNMAFRRPGSQNPRKGARRKKVL
jgi:hypothetical protein